MQSSPPGQRLCPPSAPWTDPNGLSYLSKLATHRIFRGVMDDYQDKLTIVIPETQDHDEGKPPNQHWVGFNTCSNLSNF